MRALFIAVLFAVSACSETSTNPVVIRQERLATPEWTLVSTHMGPRVGALTKVDRFTSSAERGRAILTRIEDPAARAKALADWDREVGKAIPSIVKEDDRAVVVDMLVARKILSQRSASHAEGANR